jgi:hypothetical protein|mmetsp:Transcript_4851/g.7823  ORF Transcript_4851/g.7823 Transcript_4851/m.7823 type:complete len:87 (+) Transcript_4851:337-597(+)
MWMILGIAPGLSILAEAAMNVKPRCARVNVRIQRLLGTQSAPTSETLGMRAGLNILAEVALNARLQCAKVNATQRTVRRGKPNVGT